MSEDPKEVDHQWFVDTLRALTAQVERSEPTLVAPELVEAVLVRDVESVLELVLPR